MYELYDKNGNQIGYRMTKRIKNEDGKYDVLSAPAGFAISKQSRNI